MKRIKNFTLGILGATVLSLGLFACSNDDRSEGVTTEQKLAGKSNEDILTKYYGTKLLTENALEVYDSYGTYYLTKYYNDSSNSIDIYTLTDIKGNIEFIIELDKKSFIIKSYNIYSNEINYVNNIDRITELKNSSFDLIETSKITLAGFPVFNGDRFWGWACEEKNITENPLTGEVEGCTQKCSYSVFGTKSGNNIYNCDDAPVNYKFVGKLR